MEWLWVTQGLLNICFICMLWKMQKGKRVVNTNVDVRIDASTRNPEQLAEMIDSAMKAGQLKSF